MGRGRQSRAVLLAVVCLVALTGAPTVAQTGAPPTGTGFTTQLGDAGIEPDGVLLRVDLQSDGDARWTVEYRVRLNDENTTAAFESLRADIDANETAYTTTFGSQMRATARAAENTTGRTMAIRNVSVRATQQQLPQEYGVVTYRFEWTNFARAEGDELRAGDALAGLFLDRQTTLVFAWPGEYSPTTVTPSPDERRDDSLSWVGPTDFGSGQPAVVLSTSAPSTGGTTDPGGAGGGAGNGDGSGSSWGGVMAALALGLGVLVVIGGVVLFRRRQSGTTTDVGGPAVEEATAGGDAARAASGDETVTDGSTEPTAESGAGAPSDPEADVDGATDDQSRPWEDDLLSNTERVVALLEHNGGRMKQQAIAAELEWSDAKTSQVIGKMRDAETVETFRLGRENVVSFPDGRNE